MSHPRNDCDADAEMSTIFRPPLIRTGTAAFDRALFSKTVDLAAAAVQENKFISQYRKSLQAGKELLHADRISPVAPHPDKALADKGRRCFLLNPSVKPGAPDTWGPVLKDGVQKQELTVIPYVLQLGYDYWNFRDVMGSILPEELHGDIPAGFNIAGHVAHLNLRENYLPYKHLLAEVLLDKNPQIKTVINKLSDVGTESEFRTFPYEVLAGPDDLNVHVTEGDCVFEFDYSKVYWNSKLETEHRRLINTFQPGEAVVDVMAGIGPFAVPAGKKHVFVWANDKNPESFKCLEAAIKRNKVTPFVRPFCTDGRTFIRSAVDAVLSASQAGEHANITRKAPAAAAPPNPPQPSGGDPTAPRAHARIHKATLRIPPTVAHFVMNLPASAIEFLPSFRGIYAGREALFAEGKRKLPMVHVHCFSVRSDGDAPRLDICERISRELGVVVRPAAATEGGEGGGEADGEEEGVVNVHDVRHVAPNKSMYCASFRLPREVAFAARD